MALKTTNYLFFIDFSFTKYDPSRRKLGRILKLKSVPGIDIFYPSSEPLIDYTFGRTT